MKLSLKKVSIILLIIIISSILIIVGSVLFLNSRIIKNQNQLIKTTEIETAINTMSRSLSKFLLRQEILLIAHNTDDILHLTKQIVLDQNFKEGLKKLTVIANDNNDIKESLLLLTKEYQKFVLLDNQLSDLVNAKLLAQTQLEEKKTGFVQQKNKVQLQMKQIYGILVLENIQNLRKIKILLQSPHSLDTPLDRDKFKVLISQLLLSSTSNALEKSNELNTNLSILENIIYIIIEETNTDALTNLKDNQLTQSLNQIRNELQELTTATLSHPDIHQISVDLSAQIEKVAGDVVESPNNIVQLRANLNKKDNELRQMIIRIHESQNSMIEQFDLLDNVVTKTKNILLAKTSIIAKNTQRLIIFVAIFVLLLLTILGYYLLEQITLTLQTLINAMKKIAGEDLNLTYRLETTSYEDLNEVSAAFNTMTSKLQFVHEHLQELVEKKTTELRGSETRITLRHNVTRILVEHISIDEAMIKILNTMYEFMHFCEVGLWQINPEENVLICVGCWSIEDATLKEFVDITKKKKFSLGVGLPGRAWEDKKISWIFDVVKDKNFSRAKFAEKANLHTAYAMPIILNREVIGAIEFLSRELYPFDANTSEMLSDISNQIGVFIEREETQRKVRLLSRQAGMAEVATSVLHNAGNVLNSVKVTVDLLQESMNKSYAKFKNLVKAMEMINKNIGNLSHYLSEDPKGKIIPQFLDTTISSLTVDNTLSHQEIVNLIELIHHMEEIVATQESISGSVIVTEKISLSETLEAAIRMCANSFSKHHIRVQKNYIEDLFLVTDKSKLLQILINILQNAKDALLQRDDDFLEKEISITVKKNDDSTTVDIVISDNGIGIPPENITKIFSQGFSTKSDGHGFGIHSSALLANELGGALQAKSDGVEKGASFCLTLPLGEQVNKR